MIKLGLVGCGKWGKNFLNTIDKIPQCGVEIICKKNLSNSDGIYNKNITTNIDDVFKFGVDGVIIATPPDTHFEIAKKCLDRRIPFLLEKPISLSLAEGQELIDIARNSEQPFHVNHVHLYSNEYLRMREIVRSWNYESFSGPKLPNLYISVIHGNNGPFRNYSSYVDYSPHSISMVLGLLEPSCWGSINISSFVSSLCDNGGRTYSTQITHDLFSLRSTIGNGFDFKQFYFGVSNEDLSDPHKSHVYSVGSQILQHNGVPINANGESPLTNSVNAFCDLILGVTDWRNDFALYEAVNRLSMEVY